MQASDLHKRSRCCYAQYIAALTRLPGRPQPEPMTDTTITPARPIQPDAEPMLLVRNHHVDGAPDLTDLPRGTYISYFMNEHHEQLIFVRRGSSRTAELYMGDCGWDPIQVRMREQQELEQLVVDALVKEGVKPTPARIAKYSKMLNPLVQNVIMNGPEVEWLALCWKTSSATADYLFNKEQEDA